MILLTNSVINRFSTHCWYARFIWNRFAFRSSFVAFGRTITTFTSFALFLVRPLSFFACLPVALQCQRRCENTRSSIVPYSIISNEKWRNTIEELRNFATSDRCVRAPNAATPAEGTGGELMFELSLSWLPQPKKSPEIFTLALRTSGESFSRHRHGIE